MWGKKASLARAAEQAKLGSMIRREQNSLARHQRELADYSKTRQRVPADREADRYLTRFLNYQVSASRNNLDYLNGELKRTRKRGWGW